MDACRTAATPGDRKRAESTLSQELLRLAIEIVAPRAQRDDRWQDAAQNAVIKVFEVLRTQRVQVDHPASYLAYAIRREYASLTRKDARLEPGLGDASGGPSVRGPEPTPRSLVTLPHVVDGPAEAEQALRAIVGMLSPRDLDVLLRVAAGEERESIAADLGVGRAAIDQIVRRATLRHRAAVASDRQARPEAAAAPVRRHGKERAP
jgi:hypothetical protein